MALVEQNPASAEAWLALAQVAIRLGGVQRSCEHALAAAQLRPNNPGLLVNIAGALLTVGAVRAARDCLAQAAALEPLDAGIQQALALQYQNLGDHDAALDWMQRARTSGLSDPASRFTYAIQLTFHGRISDAEQELEQCTEERPPIGRAMAQLSQSRRQTPERNHLALLERQLREVVPVSEDHAALEFARYKEFEDLGRFDDAWRSLARANNVMHARLRHDVVAEERTFEAMRRVATRLQRNIAPSQGGPAPIFIVGMPRSGTSLLDRMLGGHSSVRSVGELGTFRRCLEFVADRFTGPMLDAEFVERISRLDVREAGDRYLANAQWRAEGCRFFIDKLPRNWLLVPLIRAAIPSAKVLHMTREPMAVVFSNYRSYFGPDYPYSYDFGTLATHYRRYRQRMRDWRAQMPETVLDVSYAALVSEPEAEIRRVLAFCGLDWEPGCVDTDRNPTPVATLSAVQVRGSIEKRTGDRWRTYARQLSELRDAVEAAEDRPPVA